MLKFLRSRPLLVALVSALVMLVSCDLSFEAGLGTSLDLQGPKISITSHGNLYFVNGSFTLSGTASDNFGVTKVSLEVVDTYGAKVQGLPASIQFTPAADLSATWSYTFVTEGPGALNMPDGEYLFRFQAHDLAGNSLAESVAVITLTLDNSGPNTSVNEPRLKEKTFFATLDPTDLTLPPAHQSLENGAYFQNGQFRLKGNVDENYGLDTLDIEIWGTSANTPQLEVLALSRQITKTSLPQGVEGNLWNWTVKIDGSTVPDPAYATLDLTDVLADAQGRYILKVRTLAVDRSKNIEAADHGYICFFPESDRPWLRVSNVRAQDQVPALSQMAGNTYDDDGVKKMFLRVQRSTELAPTSDSYLNWSTSNSTEWSMGVFEVTGENANVYSWSLTLPSDAGEYRLYAQVKDILGQTLSEYFTLDFVIQDQDVPVSVASSPVDYSQVLGTDFVMSGYAYDDSAVRSLLLAWAPAGANNAELLSPELWALFDAQALDSRGSFVVTAKGGIRIWELPLGVSEFDATLPGGGRWKRTWTKNLDVVQDLDYGDLNFVLFAKDNSGNVSYTRVAYLGDRTVPLVTVTNPNRNGEYLPSSPSNPFALAGSWSDNSNRITGIQVRWVEGSERATPVAPVPAQVSGNNWTLNLPFDFPDGANNLEISATDPSGNVGYALRYLIVVNNVPVVGRVSSSNPNGEYKVGDQVVVQVEFNQPVVVSGIPTLQLALDSGTALASYTEGSGTPLLNFTYTVLSGQNTSRLNYLSTSALLLNGGTIKDVAQNNASLNLPGLDSPGSLVRNKDLKIDTQVPTVTNVSSSNPIGHYRVGSSLAFQVQFSEKVFIEGVSRLRLNTSDSTSRWAEYALGMGTSTLTYTYTIEVGDNANPLDVFSATALEGTITDSARNAGLLTLPTPGSAGSISSSKIIVVDTTAPVAPTLDGLLSGAFKVDKSFTLTGLEALAAVEYSLNGGLDWVSYPDIGVTLSNEQNYVVTARQRDQAGNVSAFASQINVVIDKTPPVAPLISGIFAGDFSIDQTFSVSGEPLASSLQYTLNGGGVWTDYPGLVTLSTNGEYRIQARQTDAAGNSSPISGLIVVNINKVAPVVVSVDSNTVNGAYKESGFINVSVTFDTPVYVIGAPRVLLNSGPSAYANYASGTGTTTLNFTYFVASGENSPDLDYASVSALGFSGATGESLRDRVGNNAVLTLPALGSLSLGGKKALIVDTTAPGAPVISGLSEGRFNSNQTFTITGEVGATFEYSLNGGASWTAGSGATLSAEGTYLVAARQRDAAGNLSTASATITLTIDKTPPSSPVVLGLVAGSYNNAQNFTVAGEDGAVFQYSLNYVAGTDETALWTEGSWQSYLGSVSISNPGTWTIKARQRDVAGNVGPSGTQYIIVIDQSPPTVASVSSITVNSAYNLGKSIDIQVTFSKAVYVTGSPRLLLETGTTDQYAMYSTGSGTNVLSFIYVVQSGDTSADLEYVATNSLGLNGGTLQDILGNGAALTLPALGSAQSLGGSKSLVIDTTSPVAPTLSGVVNGTYNTDQTFSLSGEAGAGFAYSLDGGANWTNGTGTTLSANGTYIITGRQIDLAGNVSTNATSVTMTIDKVAPSAPVVLGLVNGTYATDRTFTVAGEAGASFEYTLNWVTSDGASTWTNYPGTPVTLSTQGVYIIRARQRDSAGNVGPSGTEFLVTIDKVSPLVSLVGSSTVDGSYNLNKVLSIDITFDKAVYVTGAPRIQLETGTTDRWVAYSTGSGTTKLSFAYVVQAGDTSADLNYLSTSALELNGGTLKDVLGNMALLNLPGLATAQSLGGNKALVIDTTAPLAPSIGGVTAGSKNTTQNFTLSGEVGSSLEYSLNGGANWVTYPGSSVTLSAEGTYNLTARQTDVAGNVSVQASTMVVSIDTSLPAAPFISGITAGDKGTLQSFQVFGESGATLQYSTNNGSSWTTYSGAVSLNPGAGNETTYNVLARQTDAAGNGPVATASAITLKVDLRVPTINTYSPAHSAVNVNATGSITLTFSEPVWRESGNVVIKRITGSIPLVLTVAQYSEYLSQLQVLGNTTNLNNFIAAYRLTTNGVLAGGNPDPSSKYVLEYSRDYTDATLLPIFETLGYNTRTIPVDSTQVTGSGTNTITITPSSGLPIGIQYYVNIASTAFRDSVGNVFAGISNTTTYQFTTGPVATPVIRVNRISNGSSGTPTALTTSFKVDVETPGTTILYSAPSTSTTSDSASDYTGPLALAPATPYSTEVSLGDGTYAKGWKYYLQAQANKAGLTASAIAGERAYRTVLQATNPWFRGSNNSGGPTTAPGFPLRWEDNAVGYIRQGVLNTGNYYFITWEISEYLHFKALAGGAMTTVVNPAGYSLGTYEAGPSSYGWGSGSNYNVFPGGFRIAAHASYEALADRRGVATTWIYRP